MKDRVKNTIIIILIILVCISNVSAITSNEITYDNKTLTETLDDLYTELNTYKTGGTVTADKMLSGYTTYKNGTLITGTIEDKSASVIPGVNSQKIDAGYYPNDITVAGVTNLSSSTVKCNQMIAGVKGACTTDDMKIGDLVSYTPPAGTNNNILASWTGCPIDKSECNNQSDQTIHPEYNKLWRVLKKNTDGTVDMISEYTSMESMYFYGKEGYRVLIDGLNNIANLYKNNNYILNTRSVGYNRQTGSLATDAQVITTTGHTDFPWQNSTINNDNEAEGGGDILYQSDVGSDEYGSDEGLIYQVYKTYRGTTINPLAAYTTSNKGTQGYLTKYWLACRYYQKESAFWALNGHYVDYYGKIGTFGLWHSLYNEGNPYYNFRPILTVKKDLTITGNGTSDTPWKIN